MDMGGANEKAIYESGNPFLFSFEHLINVRYFTLYNFASEVSYVY